MTGASKAKLAHRELSAISLFSGAGGLDLGIERAGFTIRACIEKDPVRRETLRSNQPKYLPEAAIVDENGGDITRLTTETILSRAGLKRGDVDLVCGGPPCQPFSKSAYWVPGRLEALLDDPRAAMLKEFARVVKEAYPRAFLLENVFGLKYKTAKTALDALERALQEAGYKVTDPTVLYAADYGVPQRRERTFIIGIRDGVDASKLRFPPPTHRPSGSLDGDLLGDLEPYVTCREAIGDVDSNIIEDSLRVGGKWGHLLPQIPPGKNYLYFTEHEKHPKPLFKWRSKFWSFLLKLDPDDISWTIQAQPGPYVGPFHWTNRRLTIAEIKRLQTFPDDYQFSGSKRVQWAQIGDAVPPRLAFVLGQAIRKQLVEMELQHSAKNVAAQRM
jgi:DNA (cytosine-5)-methyltransferase 1